MSSPVPSATPEGKPSAREVAHEVVSRCGRCLFDKRPGNVHGVICNDITAAIEQDRASRDALHAERERVMREALERLGATRMEPTIRNPGGEHEAYEPMCVNCEMWIEHCACHGRDARRALAAAQAMKEGSGT